MGVANVLRVWSCAVIPILVFSMSIQEPIFNTVEIDPYSGSPMNFVSYNDKNSNNCYLTINNKSANGFEAMLELYRPNFVHFHLWFEGRKEIPATKAAILPNQWVWTYYSPDGFFPYLKWPVDFPILSFGLLDVKTQPKKNKIWLNINMKGNCSLKLGEPNTTKRIAYALRDMTETFLLHLQQSYRFTYYCFLEEVPNARETVAYQLAVYFGFPVEYAGYRCCRTDVPKYAQSKMWVRCMPHQVSKMFQVTIIPYVMGFIAFVYFPIFFMGFSERLASPGFYQRINDKDDQQWVFLTGKSPLTFTGLFAGFCGMASWHPAAVSRIRRFLFVLLSPSVVFIELYVYYKYQYEITMALVEHDLPMGYLSMLGGYEKSKKNYMPIFGGPFVLLPFCFIAGCFFIVLPNNLNDIMHTGCIISPGREGISPLFFNEENIEKYSGIHVNHKFGYAKAAAMGKCGLCMLVNPQFWSATFRIQIKRFTAMYNRCGQVIGSRILVVIVCIVFCTMLLPICLMELCLCIVYYGMPIVSFILIASKGYIIKLMNSLLHEENQDTLQRSAVWGHVMKVRLIRYVMTVIVSCLFIYFIFSFCTIFTASFTFVAKVIVFSLVAVIVYPSYSFGYLFFGLALLYYAYKLMKTFGDGYAELLSDAVEISQHMEEDLTMHSQVFNGTVFLNKVEGEDVTRLQINDTIVNLSTDQRQQIRNTPTTRACRTKEVNNAIGIPRDLFDILVRKYRPVHIQVATSVLLLGLVIALISITISIVVVQPQAPAEGISEIMHVVFIMIVGALPEMLGVILDRTDHATKKDIHLKKIKGTVVQYWALRKRKHQKQRQHTPI